MLHPVEYQAMCEAQDMTAVANWESKQEATVDKDTGVALEVSQILLL